MATVIGVIVLAPQKFHECTGTPSGDVVTPRSASHSGNDFTEIRLQYDGMTHLVALGGSCFSTRSRFGALWTNQTAEIGAECIEFKGITLFGPQISPSEFPVVCPLHYLVRRAVLYQLFPINGRSRMLSFHDIFQGLL